MHCVRAPQPAWSQRTGTGLPQPTYEHSFGCLNGCHGRARPGPPVLARSLTHARTPQRSRADPQHPQPGWPGASARASSCTTWESIGSSIANCCSVGVGGTPTGFLSFPIFLYILPPRASYAPFEGVVLSQNFNSFDSSPKRSPPTCSEPIGSRFFSEGHTGADSSKRSEEVVGGNSHTCCPREALA